MERKAKVKQSSLGGLDQTTWPTKSKARDHCGSASLSARSPIRSELRGVASSLSSSSSLPSSLGLGLLNLAASRLSLQRQIARNFSYLLIGCRGCARFGRQLLASVQSLGPGSPGSASGFLIWAVVWYFAESASLGSG